MGTRYGFYCKQCGLSANVSGQSDAGFIATTETKYCRTCRELYDVLTAIAHTSEPTDETRVGHCPRCKGTELTAWRRGDPCPRCCGTMQQAEIVTLWD